MKFKKTLTTILTAGMLSLPFTARAEQPLQLTPIIEGFPNTCFDLDGNLKGATIDLDFYHVAVKPEGQIEGIRTFNTLEDAVKFVPQGYEDKEVVINAFDDNFGDGTEIHLNNRHLISIKSPLPKIPITEDKKLNPPSNSARFNNRFFLEGNSSLQGIYNQRDNYVQIYLRGNNILRNCYLTYSNLQVTGATILVETNGKTNIVDNIISGNKIAGVGFSAFYKDGNHTVRGNIIYGNTNGIASYNEKSYFLGSELERGDNYLLGNISNLFFAKVPLSIPAEWNYWGNLDGRLLTTEAEIQDTIKVSRLAGSYTTNSINPEVDVVPFYTTDPFLPNASAKGWTRYR